MQYTPRQNVDQSLYVGKLVLNEVQIHVDITDVVMIHKGCLAEESV